MGLAAAGGAAPELTGSLLGYGLLNVASSVLIVNLWEELARAGFVQRRAMRTWGFLRGSLVTAALFAALHLPLAFAGAQSAGTVPSNVNALMVSAVGLRLLIGAVDGWTGGSLLTVAVVHASFNVAGQLVDPSYDWIRYAAVLALGLGALAVVQRTRANVVAR